MKGGSGQPRQPRIALDLDAFGLHRHAGQAEDRRHLALVHHAAGGKIRFEGQANDRSFEAAGIGERPAHQLGRAHGPPTVREGDGTRLGHQPQLRQGFAGQPPAQGPDRMHPGACRPVAIGKQGDHRRMVGDR